MVIELPEELEFILTARAKILGVSPSAYISEVLEKEIAAETNAKPGKLKPFKSSRGLLAEYGPAPSAEEIDANRADMFRNFGEEF